MNNFEERCSRRRIDGGLPLLTSPATEATLAWRRAHCPGKPPCHDFDDPRVLESAASAEDRSHGYHGGMAEAEGGLISGDDAGDGCRKERE